MRTGSAPPFPRHARRGVARGRGDDIMGRGGGRGRVGAGAGLRGGGGLAAARAAGWGGGRSPAGSLPRRPGTRLPEAPRPAAGEWAGGVATAGQLLGPGCCPFFWGGLGFFPFFFFFLGFFLCVFCFICLVCVLGFFVVVFGWFFLGEKRIRAPTRVAVCGCRQTARFPGSFSVHRSLGPALCRWPVGSSGRGCPRSLRLQPPRCEEKSSTGVSFALPPPCPKSGTDPGRELPPSARPGLPVPIRAAEPPGSGGCRGHRGSGSALPPGAPPTLRGTISRSLQA